MAKNIYRTNGDAILMNISNYDWADGDLERVIIEFDKAKLIIFNDTLQKTLMITCFGFAGMTDLCIWDDTIIDNIRVLPVTEHNTDFLCRLFEAYDKDYDYGGRTLSSGLLELRIELVNHIPFSVFCQKIKVTECDS